MAFRPWRRRRGSEQGHDPGDEVVQLRHLCEDVVRRRSGLPAALARPGSRRARNRRTRPASRRLARSPPRRRWPQGRCRGRYAARDEVLEQVSVVRSKLNDKLSASEREPVDHLLGVATRRARPRSWSTRRSTRSPRRCRSAPRTPRVEPAGSSRRSRRGAGRTAPLSFSWSARRKLSQGGDEPRSTSVSWRSLSQSRQVAISAFRLGTLEPVVAPP